MKNALFGDRYFFIFFLHKFLCIFHNYKTIQGIWMDLYRDVQGSKILLVRSCLRLPQAAGQVKILIFLVKIKFFPIYGNIFCDAGQVPIFRNFEA